MAFTSTGFVPDTPAQSLANIQAVFTSVFGVNTNLTPTSSNGILIQEITNDAIEVQESLTLLYDGIYNPDVASDIWLDSLCSWNGILRNPATPSVVTCQVTGLSGTIIPAKSAILNSNNDQFTNPIAITIGAGGTGSGSFQSVKTGPIQCDIGSLTRIVQQIPGWDTVNNSSAGIPGSPQQTDASLRNTRRYELGIQGVGTLNSLIAALYEDPNVIDFFVAENDTDSPITVYGVTISPHAIYVSVYAPAATQQEIAAIIYNKRSAGCGMDGNTSVIYVNPKYSWAVSTITYETPTPTAVEVDISFVDFTNSPSNLTIQNAIIANFLGQDPAIDIPAAKMGVPTYAARFYVSLSNLGIYQVTNLTIEVVGNPPGPDINLPIDQVATLAAANIMITRM